MYSYTVCILNFVLWLVGRKSHGSVLSWEVVFIDTLQLKPLLIINALPVYYNSTDHQCCSITVDSQHGYSCSYPGILCSSSKINFRLYINLLEYPLNWVFYCCNWATMYHGHLGEPPGTHAWRIVELCEGVCCMHRKRVWIYSRYRPCAKKLNISAISCGVARP